MLVPPAFNKLCRCFQQDIGEDRASPEEWVDLAERYLDENEKMIVVRFLDDLLTGHHDRAKLPEGVVHSSPHIRERRHERSSVTPYWHRTRRMRLSRTHGIF